MSVKLKKSNSHEGEVEVTFIQETSIPWPHKDSIQPGNRVDKKKSARQLYIETESSVVDRPSTTSNLADSRTSLIVNYDTESVASNLSSVSSFEGPLEDVYCKKRAGSSKSKCKSFVELWTFTVSKTEAESSRPHSTTSSISSRPVSGNVPRDATSSRTSSSEEL